MTQLTADELAEQGQQLKEMREAAKLSPLEMAVRLDVDPKTIKNWESGNTNPGRVGIIAYETVTRKKFGAYPVRVRACQHVTRYIALRLFDPDGPEVVIDLRDHVLASLNQEDARDLYRVAS